MEARMKLNGRISALFAFILFGVSGSPIAFDFSEIESKVVEFKLDNGLTFLVLPRHEAPVVSILTMVNVGSAEDPKGAAGMAHLFEHMAFKGTWELGTKDMKKEKKWMEEEDRIFDLILDERAKFGRADSTWLAELDSLLQIASDSAEQYIIVNEFAQIYKQNGGINLNAGTMNDKTFYYAKYPANRLELWMAMESDRFANPVLRQFFQEKQTIAEERRMTRESSPQGKLTDEFMAAAFKEHPYRNSGIGPMSDIQNYSRDVALAFYKKYYVPTNMVIAIVGAVDPDEVRKLAQKYFGSLPAALKPRKVMTIESPQNGERRVVIKEEVQPFYICGFHIPEVNHPDFPAVEALADHLGQGRTSRLYENLVKDKKIAAYVGAFAGYPANKYPSLFIIYSAPSKDHTNQENDTEIIAEIEKVKTELMSDEELKKIKARARAKLINELASPSSPILETINDGLAYQLAYYELIRNGWRNMFKELDRVNALTAEDIRRVANEYLDLDRRTLALLEPIEN
jgi:predicted Zn-dependent peptidase